MISWLGALTVLTKFIPRCGWCEMLKPEIPGIHVKMDERFDGFEPYYRHQRRDEHKSSFKSVLSRKLLRLGGGSKAVDRKSAGAYQPDKTLPIIVTQDISQAPRLPGDHRNSRRKMTPLLCPCFLASS